MRQRPSLRLAPFAEIGAAAALFDGPEPQLRAPWFAALAATTLAPGEEAAVAILEEQNQPRAALMLAVDGHGMARALTAPYTSLYSVAAGNPADAEALGARLAQLGLGAVMLDCLDEAAPLNAAFLAGLGRSGLVSARYRHFANWREDIEDFSAFWRRRPGQLRETVRRKSRRARQEPDLSQPAAVDDP